MSTAATQHPVVPPRPSRSQEKAAPAEDEMSMPKIPPRPVKGSANRSVSPNPDRFAPSPLNESILSKSPKAIRFSPGHGVTEFDDEPVDRSGSVAMPMVGEEGAEYDHEGYSSAGSPEQSRSVDADLKIHAPKPSLPAFSAKQRLMTVTRTDSDKAASFGIGKPSVDDKDEYKKKKSSTSVASGGESHGEDETGIPEIGRQVPMYPNAGDVQAPSPAPASGIAEGLRSSAGRKSSSRTLPPGSYGMHGHGVVSQDKLDKAYYEKYPERYQEEHAVPLHDRQNDFAMSSEDLNKIVRETANRCQSTEDFEGHPTEEIGFQAHTEYASRKSTPHPLAMSENADDGSGPQISVSAPKDDKEDDTIHIEEPGRRKSMVAFSDKPLIAGEDDEGEEEEEEEEGDYPILASDEVSKEKSNYELMPAVEPLPERRGSVFEIEQPTSRPTSRPSSRPASVYSVSQSHGEEGDEAEEEEEEEDDEPLFADEGGDVDGKKRFVKKKARHFFPSKDVWEDSPDSVHYTAEVSTPDMEAQQARARAEPSREGAETPAHAFAKQQEQLAEEETQRGLEPSPSKPKKKTTFLPLQEEAKVSRPGVAPRFPSRDVWEDTPDSHMYSTTVSGPQGEEDQPKPDVPARPAKKAERPKPKSTPSDEQARTKPAPTDKPKPQIPARPARGSDAAEGESSKSKPAVPPRPLGSKIAALQAGFMSDLNNRLKLGPQAPKKEEAVTEDLGEEKEKVPLADARKGRARGPQRRAPGSSPSPAGAAAAAAAKPASALSFSEPATSWSIDPDDGSLAVMSEKDDGGDAEEQEVKTLAANMAGEPVVEATLEKEGDAVEPVDVEETAKP